METTAATTSGINELGLIEQISRMDQSASILQNNLYELSMNEQNLAREELKSLRKKVKTDGSIDKTQLEENHPKVQQFRASHSEIEHDFDL